MKHQVDLCQISQFNYFDNNAHGILLIFIVGASAQMASTPLARN